MIRRPGQGRRHRARRGGGLRRGYGTVLALAKAEHQCRDPAGQQGIDIGLRPAILAERIGQQDDQRRRLPVGGPHQPREAGGFRQAVQIGRQLLCQRGGAAQQ